MANDPPDNRPVMTERPGGITADQAVHGYQRGHRQLASSIELSERAAGLMLGLSDLIAEPVGGDSYLVAYPMRDMNRFVFARTWLAPEMPRPGCVWTHSLILDYAAVARIPDPSVLLQLHRRPSYGTLSSYQLTVAVDHSVASGQDSLDGRRLSNALAGIYLGSGHALLSPGEDAEALPLALWRQMWPRMRRTFAFCTATATQIQFPDADASLQIIVDSYALPSVEEAPMMKVAEEDGLNALVRDAPERGSTIVRRFLSRYAPELSDQRQAAPWLALVCERLANAKTDPQVSAAVSLLAKKVPVDEGKALKTDLLLGRFRDGRAAPRLVARDFLAALAAFSEQPPFVEKEILAEHIRWLLETKSLSPADIFTTVKLGPKETLGRLTLEVLATTFSPGAGEVDVDEDILLALAEINSDLLQQPGFWPRQPADRSRLLQLALQKKVDPDQLLNTLLPTLGHEEVSVLIESGNEHVVGTLADAARRVPAVRNSMRQWAPEFAKHPAELPKAILAMAVDPALTDDFIGALIGTPGEYALNDTLLTRIVDAWGDLPDKPTTVSAFSFFRGVLYDSVTPGKLISFSLDTLLAATARRSLGEPALDVLDQRLPTLGYLTRGSLHDRIVAAVARRFVQGGVSQPWILMVTKDLGNLELVLRSAYSSWTGEQLLKEVHEKCRKSRSIPRDRIDLLEHVLWPYRRPKRKR